MEGRQLYLFWPAGLFIGGGLDCIQQGAGLFASGVVPGLWWLDGWFERWRLEVV